MPSSSPAADSPPPPATVAAVTLCIRNTIPVDAHAPPITSHAAASATSPAPAPPCSPGTNRPSAPTSPSALRWSSGNRDSRSISAAPGAISDPPDRVPPRARCPRCPQQLLPSTCSFSKEDEVTVRHPDGAAATNVAQRSLIAPPPPQQKQDPARHRNSNASCCNDDRGMSQSLPAGPPVRPAPGCNSYYWSRGRASAAPRSRRCSGYPGRDSLEVS